MGLMQVVWDLALETVLKSLVCAKVHVLGTQMIQEESKWSSWQSPLNKK